LQVIGCPEIIKSKISNTIMEMPQMFIDNLTTKAMEKEM